MYLGKVQLGQEITLGVQCRDSAGTPTAPTAAPQIEVWTGTSKVLSGKSIPTMDRYGVTGYFQYNLFLDSRFTTGEYKALYRFTAGSYYGLDEDTFEIVAGGDASGAVISLHCFNRPQAQFLVWQTDGGRIQKGRNPGV